MNKNHFKDKKLSSQTKMSTSTFELSKSLTKNKNKSTEIVRFLFCEFKRSQRLKPSEKTRDRLSPSLSSSFKLFCKYPCPFPDLYKGYKSNLNNNSISELNLNKNNEMLVNGIAGDFEIMDVNNMSKKVKILENSNTNNVKISI